jgi:acyl-CoA thioester hydrolase
MTEAFGRFEGRTHVLPVRVYYEDTDLSGVVYHANYLRYMERGRSEFFRAAGITRLAQLDEPEPKVWTLTRARLEYSRPARLDDLIEIHTLCVSLTGARLNADQSVMRSGQLLVRGEIEACVVTLSGKPRRIPRDVRERLLPFLC